MSSKRQSLNQRPEKNRALKAEAISVGDLTLNSRTFKVSRGMILERVWDMDTDPFSNIIESHILSIRKKVDSADKRKLIQTVPGRGYTIDFKSG